MKLSGNSGPHLILVFVSEPKFQKLNALFSFRCIQALDKARHSVPSRSGWHLGLPKNIRRKRVKKRAKKACSHKRNSVTVTHFESYGLPDQSVENQVTIDESQIANLHLHRILRTNIFCDLNRIAVYWDNLMSEINRSETPLKYRESIRSDQTSDLTTDRFGSKRNA